MTKGRKNKEYRSVKYSAIGKSHKLNDKPNEDSVIMQNKSSNNQIYIVADGMGGHNAGEIASHLSANFMHVELKSLVEVVNKQEISENEILHYMNHIVNVNNHFIATSGKKKTYFTQNNGEIEIDDIEGYGTTLDACIIHDHYAYIAHVGNGRIYKISKKNGKKDIRKITKEHVEYPLFNNGISDEEKTVIEMSLGLSEYIGNEEGVNAELIKEKLNPGDKLIIGTDGLTHNVSETEIKNSSRENLITYKKKITEIIKKPNKIAKAYSKFHKMSKNESIKKLSRDDDASFIIVGRYI